MLVALKEGTELRYIHQDHLTGTALTTSTNGTSLGTIKYYPFGGTRLGDVPTDKKFTGQRLDEGTGLYYYGARYYDPAIGRFISADSFVQWSAGFDVVSTQLTINAIPQGLGTALAYNGNYPKSTFQAPENPQTLNRYSYVLNNPLTYNDPYGWLTFNFGFNFSFRIGGFGIDFNRNVAADAQGKRCYYSVIYNNDDPPSLSWDISVTIKYGISEASAEDFVSGTIEGGTIYQFPLGSLYDVYLNPYLINDIYRMIEIEVGRKTSGSIDFGGDTSDNNETHDDYTPPSYDPPLPYAPPEREWWEYDPLYWGCG